MSDIPTAIEAERALLGIAMLDGATRLAEIAELVSDDDFYREAHQEAFRLMIGMLAAGEPIEMVSVVEKAARLGLADKMGGFSYLSALPDNVPSSENFAHYADTVKEARIRRQLIEAGGTATEAGKDASLSVGEALEKAGAAILGIDAEGKQAGGWVDAHTVAGKAWDEIEATAEAPGAVTGMPTGLRDLDKILSGLQRTDMVVLAARPAMGKTALCGCISRAVSESGAAVGIFSLEMGDSQIMKRLIGAEARVPAGKIRTGHLSGDDRERISAAAATLAELPIYIDDTPGLSPVQFRARAKRLKALDPSLGLIVVDYIGLMGGEKGVARHEQISVASRTMKLVAKELDVCVLCLSQLNRNCENRNPPVPIMADLRDSGAIEQDADVIMFIFRDEQVNPETTTRPGEADIIVAKQRNGATGIVVTAFEGQYTRFSDLARHEGYDYP